MEYETPVIGETTFQYLFAVHQDLFELLTEIETDFHVYYQGLIENTEFKRVMFNDPTLPGCDSMMKMALIMLLMCFGREGFSYLYEHHRYTALGCCFFLIDKVGQTHDYHRNFVPMLQQFVTRRVCTDYPRDRQLGLEMMRPYIDEKIAAMILEELKTMAPISLH